MIGIVKSVGKCKLNETFVFAVSLTQHEPVIFASNLTSADRELQQILLNTMKF